MNIGFIYCLSNPAMPGLCKIGRTDRAPSMRCWELSSSTSAPLGFEIEFYVEVVSPDRIERAIHAGLDEHRINPSREFFKCLPGLAFHWLQCNADILSECIKSDVWGDINKLESAGLLPRALKSNVIEVDF